MCETHGLLDRFVDATGVLRLLQRAVCTLLKGLCSLITVHSEEVYLIVKVCAFLVNLVVGMSLVRGDVL